MRNLTINDITLCTALAAEQLSFREKVQAARLLGKMHVSQISLPEMKNHKADALLARTVASVITDTVLCARIKIDGSDAEQVYASIATAKHKKLAVALPASQAQLEFFCHIKPVAVLDTVKKGVCAARALCDSVEFIAEDALRGDYTILIGCIKTAIEAGADTITICDPEGYALPAEMIAFIEKLYADVPALKEVTLGLHCSNACKLAPATVLESLSAGVGQIDLCCAGDQAPNVATVLAILSQRSEKLGVHTDVLYTEAKTCAAAAASLFDKKAGNKVGAVLQNENEGITLDANADKYTVLAAVAKLGYTLSCEDALRVYEEFGQIAASKPIGTRELDTIVAAVAMQVPATYKLINYVINSGNTFSSSAHVTVEKSGKVLQAISLGDGPIDAAFKALEQIVGHHYELDDFQIHAVTEGREAVGSALVKLRSEGALHAGQGVSTDIIGASIRAYLDAINKIVYEEGRA